MRFFGRDQELSALEWEYKRDGGFVVVYGRRRVGKTTLIKQAEISFLRSDRSKAVCARP